MSLSSLFLHTEMALLAYNVPIGYFKNVILNRHTPNPITHEIYCKTRSY